MERSKLWTKEYIITTLVNFLAAMNFYLLMVVISEYAMNRFHSSSGQAGFTASIFVIGALIARLLAGKQIARVGYKKMLWVGLSANIVMTLAYFGVNKAALLLLIRFLHGAAFGIASTSSATIVADIVPKDKRGEGIGYYSLSQTFATAIGPFLGIFLSQHGSYRMIFIACVIASAISMIIAPFLSLRKIELTDEQVKGMQGYELSNFIEYKAVPISAITLLIYVCYSSIVSFLTVYSKEIHLVDAASFFFIVYAAVVLASRPIVGRMFDKKGENVIMYPAIHMFAIGMFLFSQSYYGVVLLLAAALIGLGLGAIQSSTQAIVVKVTPRHRMGLANSTYFMLADIGMGIGPLLVGFLIPFTGYRGMYSVMAVIALACILLYLLLHGKRAASKK